MLPVIALSLFAVACAPQAQQYPNRIASVREDMISRLPQKDVQRFMNALRSDVPEQPGCSVNVNEWQGYGRSANVDASVYEAALDDARRKALAIARRMGTGLGSVQSVSEFSGAADASGAQGRGMPLKGAPVMTSAGQPVALGVVYRTSNGGDIAVFGLGDAAAHGAPQGVQVSINASAPTLDEARKRVAAVESSVRAIARKFGLPDTAVTVDNLGFDRY